MIVLKLPGDVGALRAKLGVDLALCNREKEEEAVSYTGHGGTPGYDVIQVDCGWGV